MHWVHFVGRSYYSEKSFIKEAKMHGVTRRVSLKTLKQMDFGHVVWLAINDGKSSVMFGKYVIDNLFGIPMRPLVEAGAKIEKVADGGRMVSRGCGSYMSGPSFALTSKETMGGIAESLEGVDCKPMVGGKFIQIERVRLSSMRQHQGFRPFDSAKFLAAVKEAKGKMAAGKTPAVKGFFYWREGVSSTNVVSLDERRVTETVGYKSK